MKYYDEVPKYRKKAKKKKHTKSDHKHDYKDYIGRYIKEDKTHVYPIKKCLICGKTEFRTMFFYKDVIVNDKPYKQMVSDLNEVKDLYPHLNVIDLEKSPFD